MKNVMLIILYRPSKKRCTHSSSKTGTLQNIIDTNSQPLLSFNTKLLIYPPHRRIVKNHLL
jgi:hypothetical protein